MGELCPELCPGRSGQEKTHGLIVDYLGIFDDVAQAIQFDEEGITRVVSNIAELKNKLPEAIQKCLEYFPGVDRTLMGYGGLIAAQECLPNNKVRDLFAADCSYLARLWEAILPDAVLNEHETDYRWLVQVYESVKPVSNIGRLLWHQGARVPSGRDRVPPQVLRIHVSPDLSVHASSEVRDR